MLALAGYPLGLHFRFLDPSPEAPVGRIAQRVTADYTDQAALEKFSSGLELVTYEFENVPVEAARFLADRVPVYPPPAALEAAQDRLAVLKTSRMGYDGKGQWILRTAEDVAKAKSELPPVKLILERFVPFTRELSVLAVRSRNGESAIYPLVENHHRSGILRLSLAPAPRLDADIQRAAERAAHRILESLKYVGVLAIE